MPNMLIQPAPVPSIAEAQRNALAIRGGQMQNALARQKLQDYPEEQAWTREKRGMEREDYEYTKHLREFQTSMEPLVKLEALDKMMRLVANKTTLANHDMVTANLAKQLGVDPSQAQQEPTAAQIAQQAQAAGEDPETYYQTVYKPQALMTWEQKFELMEEQVKTGNKEPKLYETEEGWQSAGEAVGKKKPTKEKWSAPKSGLDEQGNPIVYRVNDQGKVDILEGVKPEPKKGMKIYDRDGNLLVDTGGSSGAEGMTKKTQGMIEEKLISGKEQLARIQQIASEFKPEYQEIGFRLSASWTGIKAKLGRDVDPEDAKFLTDFKAYQRKAIENINLYIKEMTGAQMSEKEASRLRLAQPDPGEKWYKGDDPITFKSKLDDVVKTTRAAVARYEYYKSKGLSDQEVKAIIQQDKAISLETIASRMK